MCLPSPMHNCDDPADVISHGKIMQASVSDWKAMQTIGNQGGSSRYLFIYLFIYFSVGLWLNSVAVNVSCAFKMQFVI